MEKAIKDAALFEAHQLLCELNERVDKKKFMKIEKLHSISHEHDDLLSYFKTELSKSKEENIHLILSPIAFYVSTAIGHKDTHCNNGYNELIFWINDFICGYGIDGTMEFPE